MAEKKLRFAIFGNGSKALESIQIWEMLDYLIKHSAEVYVEQSFYDALQHQLKDDLEVDGLFEGSDFNADYVISLGGDGTFLKAASSVGAKQIPIIGVNMGRLGFLANVAPADVISMLDNIFAGQYDIEERVVIQLDAGAESLEGCPCALNDIAILKRDTASMISIRASVNGEYLVTYLADGLVIRPQRVQLHILYQLVDLSSCLKRVY